MLSSITPFGERSRGFSWRLTAVAFAAGAVAAGALTGALLGAVGLLLPAGTGWRAATAAVLLLLTAALDAPPLHRHLPSFRRQVNEDWLARYRGWVYGVGFGAQLGLGVATIVTSAAIYAAAMLAVLSGRPLAGALIGGVFGAVRALSLLPARRVHDPAGLLTLHRRLQSLEHPVASAVLALESVVALLAVGGALW